MEKYKDHAQVVGLNWISTHYPLAVFVLLPYLYYMEWSFKTAVSSVFFSLLDVFMRVITYLGVLLFFNMHQFLISKQILCTYFRNKCKKRRYDLVEFLEQVELRISMQIIFCFNCMLTNCWRAIIKDCRIVQQLCKDF